MSLAELVITSVVVEGRTKSEVARDYKVSRYWVHQLVKRHEAEGVAAFQARSASVWQFEQASMRLSTSRPSVGRGSSPRADLGDAYDRRLAVIGLLPHSTARRHC